MESRQGEGAGKLAGCAEADLMDASARAVQAANARLLESIVSAGYGVDIQSADDL